VIALSTRYAWWLVFLLGAALVPVALGFAWPRRHDDCRHPDMLTLTLAIPGSKPTSSAGRRAAPAPARPADEGAIAQWTEGALENPEPGGAALGFWIVRTFDPALASPRIVLRGSFDPESHELRELETASGLLPVHVAIDRTRGPSRVVAWAWAYDGRPTADVFPALLRAAPKRLFQGAVPVTLFLVDGSASDPETARVEATATQWISDAWSHMARYCR
jgi:hypothetical protein